MEPGERFGYRKPWTAIGEPVCPVEVVREGSHRSNKVRVRWLSGEPYSLGPQSAGHGPMQCAAELWPCPRQKLPGQFTTAFIQPRLTVQGGETRRVALAQSGMNASPRAFFLPYPLVVAQGQVFSEPQEQCGHRKSWSLTAPAQNN